MWKISILLLCSIVPFHGALSAGNTCNDLANYTCSDKVLNHGSGLMRGSDRHAKSKAESQRRQSFNELIEDYKKALNSTENPVDQKTLKTFLNAAKLRKSKDCRKRRNPPKDKRLLESCADAVANALAIRAYEELYAEETLYGRGVIKLDDRGSLKLEIALRKTDLYSDVREAQRSRVIAHNKEIYKSLDKSLETAFKDTKELVLDFVNRNISNSFERSKILSSVRTLQFDGSECLSKFPFVSNLSSLFLRVAYYTGFNHTISYCRGMADYGVSKYQLVSVFAHEIAHSIDPCRLADTFSDTGLNYKNTSDPENNFPFKVLKCLRSEKSVHAYGTASDDLSDEEKEISKFCHNTDQINESFCDWMGAEILYRYMKTDLSKNTQQKHYDGVASAWRYLCEDKEGLGSSTLGQERKTGHPSSVDRLNRIVLAHPGIRREIGCEPLGEDVQYCDKNKNQQPLPLIPGTVDEKDQSID